MLIYCLLGYDTIVWKVGNIPEDGNLNSHPHENPKSHSVWPQNIFEVVSSENYIDHYQSLQSIIVWHMDLLLSNNHETDNCCYQAVAHEQQQRNGFFCVGHAEML